MNFEQLEYLKEVIETKSMSIAAKNLHVTQSAISQSISLLEKEFGVQLLNAPEMVLFQQKKEKISFRKHLRF